MTTTIQISDKLWQELTKQKTPEDKTFEEVIWKILQSAKPHKGVTAKSNRGKKVSEGNLLSNSRKSEATSDSPDRIQKQ